MLKLLRFILLVFPILSFCIEAESKEVSQSLFTFEKVVKTLEAKGYSHIKTIHQHSNNSYEVCAGKNANKTDLFLIKANGIVKTTVTDIDITPYSWSPQDVFKANDVFVKKVHHPLTFFEVQTLQTAVMSTSDRDYMWHYNKEKNVIYKTLPY